MLGIGGGVPLLKMFSTQSNHGARLKTVEDGLRNHGKKIDETHTTVTQLKVISERTEKDVTTILGLMKEK